MLPCPISFLGSIDKQLYAAAVNLRVWHWSSLRPAILATAPFPQVVRVINISINVGIEESANRHMLTPSRVSSEVVCHYCSQGTAVTLPLPKGRPTAVISSVCQSKNQTRPIISSQKKARKGKQSLGALKYGRSSRFSDCGRKMKLKNWTGLARYFGSKKRLALADGCSSSSAVASRATAAALHRIA